MRKSYKPIEQGAFRANTQTDGKGNIMRLDCFVVPPRKDVSVGSSWQGTKPFSSGLLLDCFVVPPRNDGKGVHEKHEYWIASSYLLARTKTISSQ